MKRWKVETETDTYDVCAEEVAVADGHLSFYRGGELILFVNALAWEAVEAVSCTDETDCCQDDSCCDAFGEDGCC